MYVLVASSTKFNLFLIMAQSLKVTLVAGMTQVLIQISSFVHAVTYGWVTSKVPLVETGFLTCQSEHGNRGKGIESHLIVKRYLFLSPSFSVQRPCVFRVD